MTRSLTIGGRGGRRPPRHRPPLLFTATSSPRPPHLNSRSRPRRSRQACIGPASLPVCQYTSLPVHERFIWRGPTADRAVGSWRWPGALTERSRVESAAPAEAEDTAVGSVLELWILCGSCSRMLAQLSCAAARVVRVPCSRAAAWSLTYGVHIQALRSDQLILRSHTM